VRAAEWNHHRACWLAWPRREPWLDDLAAVGADFDQLCESFAAVCTAIGQSERLHLLVHDDDVRHQAKAALAHLDVEYVPIQYGDIWLRDTAPVFTHRDGQFTSVVAGFNGWGGEYLFEHDDRVALAIADYAYIYDRFPEAATIHKLDMVFEGGALDVDGNGNAITTRQCLQNRNRNPDLSEADIEALLRDAFGITYLHWLDEGLANDHTDGHVDTLARFVAPEVVMIMEPAADDPNRDALMAIKDSLSGFEQVVVPSPGAITRLDGELLPASYLNFYISNGAVVVPTYGSRYDDAAVAAIAAAFTDRNTIALDARIILAGGGAFHCITQEQP